MPTDKTGAEATVSAAEGKYTIAVAGETVGLAAVADRDNQRIFYHTEVEEQFGGRGLATILVAEALEATRADGKRVVPLCPMVAAFIKKHPEFNDITDHPVEKWYRDAKLYTIFEGTSEIQRIVISTALGATEGAPPLHVELEPTGGPLNRVFGRGTLLRGRVADAALAAKDRLPEPLMRVAMQALRPPRK